MEVETPGEAELGVEEEREARCLVGDMERVSYDGDDRIDLGTALRRALWLKEKKHE